MACHGPRRLALLLPSLWLLLALVLPEAGAKPWPRALFYVAILLTLAGAPFLAALLLRVTIAGYAQIPNRRRLLAAAIVGIVAIASFGLGKFNNRFLTCNDFVISGNDTPPSAAMVVATWATASANAWLTIMRRDMSQDISPCSWAYAAAAVRDDTSSLVKMLLRCRSTVF